MVILKNTSMIPLHIKIGLNYKKYILEQCRMWFFNWHGFISCVHFRLEHSWMLLLHTRGAHYLRPAGANKTNQSDFVIWPHSFSQLSGDLKNSGDLELELNYQNDWWTMSMAPTFSRLFSTWLGLSQPPRPPASPSLPQWSCLGIFIVKYMRLPCILGSVGDGGG